MGKITLNPNLEREVAESAVARDACRQSAELGAEYARAIAPVGSAADYDDAPGAYRDSIHAEETADGARIVAGTDHAVYVEVGTSDTPAFHVLGRTGEALHTL